MPQDNGEVEVEPEAAADQCEVETRENKHQRYAEDTCVECGMVEPSKRIARGKQIAWIQCDTRKF